MLQDFAELVLGHLADGRDSIPLSDQERDVFQILELVLVVITCISFRPFRGDDIITSFPDPDRMRFDPGKFLYITNRVLLHALSKISVKLPLY